MFLHNVLLPIIALLLLCSCTKRTARTTYEKSGVQINNFSQKDIKKVFWRHCNSGDDSFFEISKSNISSGKSLFIDIKLNCVDLKALSDANKVVTQLDGVSLPPRFHWDIKETK